MRMRILLTAVILLSALTACTQPVATEQAATLTPAATVTSAATATATTAATSAASKIITAFPTIATTAVPQPQVACPTANKQAQQAYDSALEAASSGDYTTTVTLLNQALDLDPSYCDAMDALGQALRMQQNIDDSVTWLEKAVDLAPQQASFIAHLGIAYTLQGQVDQGIEAFNNVIRLTPDSPDGYYGLGSIYYVTQQYEQAIAPFTRAEEIYAAAGSDYVIEVRYLLGLSYFFQMYFDEARDIFLSIYDNIPQDASINYALGYCYLYGQEQDVAQAQHYLDIAASLGVQIPDEIKADLSLASGTPLAVETPTAEETPTPQ